MNKQFLIPGIFSICIIPPHHRFKVGQVIAAIMLNTAKESCEDLIKRTC